MVKTFFRARFICGNFLFSFFHRYLGNPIKKSFLDSSLKNLKRKYLNLKEIFVKAWRSPFAHKQQQSLPTINDLKSWTRLIELFDQSRSLPLSKCSNDPQCRQFTFSPFLSSSETENFKPERLTLKSCHSYLAKSSPTKMCEC